MACGTVPQPGRFDMTTFEEGGSGLEDPISCPAQDRGKPHAKQIPSLNSGQALRAYGAQDDRLAHSVGKREERRRRNTPCVRKN